MIRCGLATTTGTPYPPPAPRLRQEPARPVVAAPEPPPVLDVWGDGSPGDRVRWEPVARLAAKGVAPVEGVLRKLGKGSTTRFARIDTGDRTATVWENQGSLRVVGAAAPASARSPEERPIARPARAPATVAPPRAAESAPAPSMATATVAAVGGDPKVFVVLKPPPDVAARLAARGTVPADDVHVTLAFIGRRSSVGPERMAAMAAALRRLASSRPGVVGETTSFTQAFPGGAQYLGVDGAAVAHLREAVVGAIESAGVPVDRTHTFTAHVTLDPKGADRPSMDVPPEVMPFTDLWLCEGHERCERIPFAHPERVERVAAARRVRADKYRHQEAARGRGRWKDMRAANSWAEQVAASTENVGRMERSYGMLPAETTPRVPSPTEGAPGLATPAPLTPHADLPKASREALPKAVRAVETVLPLVRRFPDAAPAVAAARRAVERGTSCQRELYPQDALDRDREVASGVELLALMAVHELASSCYRDGSLQVGYAEHAERLARDVADYQRWRAASPPVDFSVVLREPTAFGDNPTLSLGPDPTPAEAAREVAEWARESEHGDLMLDTPSDLVQFGTYDAMKVQLWNRYLAEPGEMRRRAEMKLVHAIGELMRRARRLARSGVADTGYNTRIGEARSALGDLDAMRTMDVARAAGVRSASVKAYPLIVAQGRELRAEQERRMAAMGPKADAAVDALKAKVVRIALDGVGAYERAVNARPDLRRASPPGFVALVRASLAAAVGRLDDPRRSILEVARLYNERWVDDLSPEGNPLPEKRRSKHGEELRGLFCENVVQPVVAAAREAILKTAPFVRKLDEARARHEQLAEERLLADPWRAVYGRPDTMARSYEHTYDSVITQERNRL